MKFDILGFHYIKVADYFPKKAKNSFSLPEDNFIEFKSIINLGNNKNFI